MAELKWSGQALKDLFQLSATEVSHKYGVTTEGVYTKRKKIRRQAIKAKRLMEKDPTFTPTEAQLERIEFLQRTEELLQDFQEAGLPVDPADAPNVKSIRLWTQHSVDRETGEPVQSINRYINYDPSGKNDDDEYFPPAEPANIRPTRRKKKTDRDEKHIFVFSDAQMDFRRVIDPRTNEMELIPTHDPRAIRLAHLICADLQPDEIWNAGDTMDLAALSRFKPDSDHFHKTIGPTLQAIHNMYAQFRADNPDAKIVEVDSNHNTRLRDFILKYFPQAYDLYRPGEESEFPVMSYPYLANFSALEIEWISGYGAAQYTYGEDYYEEIDGRMHPKPPLVLRHGTETSNNGQTAGKIYRNNPNAIAVQGHDHDPQQYFRTNHIGQRVGAIIVPPLCKTTGEVSSYHSAVDDKNRVVPTQETWTQGAVHIVDHGGEYEFNTIFFRNGIAHYRGKTYDANEN